MRTPPVLILSGALAAAAARLAAAQPAPAPEPAPSPSPEATPAPVPPPPLAAGASPILEEGDATRSPGFLTIDRIDGDSRIAIQASYLEPDVGEFTGDKPTLLRFAAHARYVHPSGVGGYAQLPFAYGSDDGGDMDTITDLGNLELGGLYAVRRTGPGLGLIVHAGVTLPTGETGVEGLLGTVMNVVALPDFYNSLPKGITFKLGFSPVIRRGMFFGRFDLGFDANIDAEDTVIGKGFHYNFGAGFDLGSASVTLESQNLSITDDREGSDASGVTFNVLALGARAYLGAVLPYIAIVIPLDEDVSNTIDFAVTLGAEFQM